MDNIDKSLQVKFFYWADKEDGRLSSIKKSAFRNGIRIEPIGRGTLKSDWHHSLFKQKALYDAVKNLDNEKIVCATDGFDVFYQQDAEYIKSTFLSFDCEIVFSGERGYYHQYRKYKKFFDSAQSSSPYKYLNAGSVIGYAGALKRLYQPGTMLGMGVAVSSLPLSILLSIPYASRIGLQVLPWVKKRWTAGVNSIKPVSFLKWYRYTDQAMMARHMAKGTHNISIKLDRDCRLFGCTAFEWEDIDNHYLLAGGRLKNVHTGQTPACIHVPALHIYKQVFLSLFNKVYPG